MIRSAVAPLAAGFLLGGCSQHPETPSLDSATESAGTAGPASAAPLPTQIPEGMRGRWGVVPADCNPNRSDAKGLMTVDARTLDFYESRGVLEAVSAGDAMRLRATFAMTGEGLRWTRDQMLALSGDKGSLVRQEFGKDANPGPLTYHRCP